jgi:hypothetical protein
LRVDGALGLVVGTVVGDEEQAPGLFLLHQK